MAGWLRYSSVKLSPVRPATSIWMIRSCSSSNIRYRLDYVRSLSSLRLRVLELRGRLNQCHVEVVLGRLSAFLTETGSDYDLQYVRADIVLMLLEEVKRINSPFLDIKFACALRRLGISHPCLTERLSNISFKNFTNYTIDVLFVMVEMISRTKLLNDQLNRQLFEEIVSRHFSDPLPMYAPAVARLASNCGDSFLISNLAAFHEKCLLEEKEERFLEVDVMYLMALAELSRFHGFKENYVNAVCTRHPVSNIRGADDDVLLQIEHYSTLFSLVSRHKQVLSSSQTMGHLRDVLENLLSLPGRRKSAFVASVISCGSPGYHVLDDTNIFINFLTALEKSNHLSVLPNDLLAQLLTCMPRKAYACNVSAATNTLIKEVTLRVAKLSFAQTVDILEFLERCSVQIFGDYLVDVLIAHSVKSDEISKQNFQRFVAVLWRILLCDYAVKLPPKFMELHIGNALCSSVDLSTLSHLLKAYSLCAFSSVEVAVDSSTLETALEVHWCSLHCDDVLAVLLLSAQGVLKSRRLRSDAFRLAPSLLFATFNINNFLVFLQLLVGDSRWTEVFEVVSRIGTILYEVVKFQRIDGARALSSQSGENGLVSSMTIQEEDFEVLMNSGGLLQNLWKILIESNIYSEAFNHNFHAILRAVPARIRTRLVHYTWAAYCPHLPPDVEGMVLQCLFNDWLELKEKTVSEQVKVLWAFGVRGLLDLSPQIVLDSLLRNRPANSSLEVKQQLFDLQLYNCIHNGQKVSSCLPDLTNYDKLLPHLTVDASKWQTLVESIFQTDQTKIEYNTCSANGLFLPVAVERAVISESLFNDLKALVVRRLLLVPVPDCLCLRTPEEQFGLFIPELRFRLELYKKAGWHPVVLQSDLWDSMDYKDKAKQAIFVDILGMASALSYGR